MRTRSPSPHRGILWDAPCRGGALLRPLLQISSEERAGQSPAPTKSPQEGNIHLDFQRTFYLMEIVLRQLAANLEPPYQAARTKMPVR